MIATGTDVSQSENCSIINNTKFGYNTSTGFVADYFLFCPGYPTS